MVGKGRPLGQICKTLPLSFCGKLSLRGTRSPAKVHRASKESWIWSSVPTRLCLAGCGKLMLLTDGVIGEGEVQIPCIVVKAQVRVPGHTQRYVVWAGIVSTPANHSAARLSGLTMVPISQDICVG